MNEDKELKLAIKRAQDLLAQRKEILSLSPEKALSAILDAPQPTPLVHSFPEQDFYYLIHDIGIADALPILSLASDRQWEYMLDMEMWERDRINAGTLSRWLDLLFKVDPNRFVRWFFQKKTELVEYCLFKHIEVRIREYDQSPSDFGNDFFTLDETFYVRIIDYPFDQKLGPDIRKINQDFLPRFLAKLAEHDPVKYQHVLLESQTIIPGEFEEEAYRLRNVRLAEKGFLPFEEAVGIYQPLSPDDLKSRHPTYVPGDADIHALVPVPLYPSEMLEADTPFTRSLKMIDSNDILQQIQTEFADLANQIITADRKQIKQRDELGEIIKKACGYISIGLEALAGENKKTDSNLTAELLQKFPVSRIFSVGYGRALKLKWRAERWRKQSWFESRNLPLSFWDEQWLGVLGGLLIKRPMFFDDYKTNVLYREFYSTGDVDTTETILDEIIAADNIFSLMAPKFEPVPDTLLTYKNLALTLWAKHCLGLPEEPLPISLESFKGFFDDLWSGTDMPRKIPRSMKESFLFWLSERTALQPDEIIQSLGQTLENLFAEIESEYGAVSKKALDPKFISLFLTTN
ncbi:DUF6178 family protein [Thermodesulfobacteriota bacterium]